MAPQRPLLVDDRDQPAWVGWVKFLWIVLIAVACYYMAEDMVQHHFFDGGVLNNRISHLRY